MIKICNTHINRMSLNISLLQNFKSFCTFSHYNVLQKTYYTRNYPLANAQYYVTLHRITINFNIMSHCGVSLKTSVLCHICDVSLKTSVLCHIAAYHYKLQYYVTLRCITKSWGCLKSLSLKK